MAAADIVTPDGKLHTDDPKVREAAIKSVEFMTKLYKEGFVPPEALSWNDADDNNGYHEKLFVMDFDGTLSTELAMIKDEQAYYHEMKMTGYPSGNDGKPMKRQVGAGGGYIPKGAKNVEVAKDFMKYFMQPKVMNENLKGGLGRWVPPMPQIVKRRPVLAGSPRIRSASPMSSWACWTRRWPSITGSIRPGASSTPSSSGGQAMPTSSRTA